MNQLIENHSNAKRFLSECNSIAILNQYRGAALKQCALTRRKLLNEILKMEMKRC